MQFTTCQVYFDTAPLQQQLFKAVRIAPIYHRRIMEITEK